MMKCMSLPRRKVYIITWELFVTVCSCEAVVTCKIKKNVAQVLQTIYYQQNAHVMKIDCGHV